MIVRFNSDSTLTVGGHILAPLSWDDFTLPAPFAGPPTWHAGDFRAGRSPSSRFYRYRYNSRPHLGIDIGKSSDYGKPIGSAAEGVVVATSTSNWGGAGRTAKIVHNRAGIPTYTYYIHLASVDVKPGDRVSRGQKIGTMGGSGWGRNTGYTPHLHTEIWEWIENPARNDSHNVHVDPQLVYFGKASGKAGHPVTQKALFVKLQGRLSQLGFNPGTIDGQYGSKTSAAEMLALDELEACRASGGGPVDGIPAGEYVGADGTRIGLSEL